jgi:hypothetical protein
VRGGGLDPEGLPFPGIIGRICTHPCEEGAFIGWGRDHRFLFGNAVSW